MNQAPYIPAKDADFENWLANFSTLLTANPTDYGLTAPDAVIVAAQYSAWNAAFLLATNPATRTSPAVAAKDGARVTATGVVRPYAVAISRNPAVLDADKLSIGVNLPNFTPVPIPPITDVPSIILQSALPNQHTLQFRSSGAPTSKAKPFGVIGLELFRNIGTVAATSPEQCTLYTSATKTPFVVSTDPANAGQVITYFSRWTNRSGAGGQAYKGPWSAPLVLIAG